MVAKIVILDSGPLGLVTKPNPSTVGVACAEWLKKSVADGIRVIVPEIADYEVRRELIRANKQEGLAQLDAITRVVEYLPISTGAMRSAARLWAQARQAGQPTAGDKTIDGDMILVGQALSLGEADFVVATTNLGHLSRFIVAELWTNL